MTKYKVVVPDAITWEFDEIVAGGQNDRYAMTITLAPYGTLINDPKLSKTAGRWAWAVAPGASFARGKQRERWRLDVRRAERVQEQGVGVRVHPVRLQQGMDAPLGGARQRAAARVGAEPAGRCRRGLAGRRCWPRRCRPRRWSRAIRSGRRMELQLRSGISQVLLGQKTAKVALDAVAADWQRSLRRAGLKG